MSTPAAMANFTAPSAARSLLLTLLRFAYKSQVRLPFLISTAFMLFDLHLRLDVEVDARIIEQDVEEEEEQQEHEGEDVIEEVFQ